MTDEESDIDDELDEEEAPPSRFALFYERNRRRFQLIALAIFLVAVGLELSSAYPREVRVSLRFPAAAEVREASIEYRQEGEVVRQLQQRFPEGAPSDVRDVLELSPGDYDVEVTLTDSVGQSRALSGTLSAPADGVVRVALE